MVKFRLTDEELALAADLGKEIGVRRDSIRRGGGNFVGACGEIGVAKILSATHDPTYEYDITLVSGATCEVKSKETTVTPKKHFDASVAAANTSQKCDAYVFVRMLAPDFRYGWATGWLPRKSFFSLAKFWEKGEVDPSNGWECLQDCYNVQHDQLRLMQTIDNSDECFYAMLSNAEYDLVRDMEVSF